MNVPKFGIHSLTLYNFVL